MDDGPNVGMNGGKGGSEDFNEVVCLGVECGKK